MPVPRGKYSDRAPDSRCLISAGKSTRHRTGQPSCEGMLTVDIPLFVAFNVSSSLGLESGDLHNHSTELANLENITETPLIPVNIGPRYDHIITGTKSQKTVTLNLVIVQSPDS